MFVRWSVGLLGDLESYHASILARILLLQKAVISWPLILHVSLLYLQVCLGARRFIYLWTWQRAIIVLHSSESSMSFFESWKQSMQSDLLHLCILTWGFKKATISYLLTDTLSLLRAQKKTIRYVYMGCIWYMTLAYLHPLPLKQESRAIFGYIFHMSRGSLGHWLFQPGAEGSAREITQCLPGCSMCLGISYIGGEITSSHHANCFLQEPNV